MKANHKLTTLFSATFMLAAFALCTTALAYSGGPPNAMTGAPGEGVCTACHNSFLLNSGSGSLSIDGIGGDYTPGQTYSIQFTLADPGASRWGFEARVYKAGAVGPIGNFAPIDPTTQVSEFPLESQYLKQTSAGTFMGQTGSATWEVDWTAPEEGTGPITILVAGNAANGNFNFLGDYIYANSLPLSEIVANEEASWSDIKALYR